VPVVAAAPSQWPPAPPVVAESSTDRGAPAKRLWTNYRGLPLGLQVAAAVLVGLLLIGSVRSAVENRETHLASGTSSSPSEVTEFIPPTTEVVPTTAEPTTEAPTTVLPVVTAPPATAPPVTAPPSTRATVARAAVAPATTAAPAQRCHPSYEGTCIPPDVSDADCAGGSGDGPWYVYEKNIRVVGPDVFGLDSDHDGIGCESH